MQVTLYTSLLHDYNYCIQVILIVIAMDSIQWEEYYFNEPLEVNVHRIESHIPLPLNQFGLQNLQAIFSQ